MIRHEPVQLSQSEQELLRAWLKDNSRMTLELVVESLAKIQLCGVLEDAIKAKDFPAKLEGSNSKLIQAQRYATFLEVLREIVTQQGPFVTVRLK